MVVKPNDSPEFTDKQCEIIECLESKIDCHLSEGKRYINLSWGEYCDMRIRNEIQRKYQKVGWNVKWHHGDQRDEFYAVSFTKPKVV